MQLYRTAAIYRTADRGALGDARTNFSADAELNNLIQSSCTKM